MNDCSTIVAQIRTRSFILSSTINPLGLLYFNIIIFLVVLFLFDYRFEKEVFTEWAEGVDAVAKTNLEKPLLVRERKDDHDLIRINFNPKV